MKIGDLVCPHCYSTDIMMDTNSEDDSWCNECGNGEDGGFWTTDTVLIETYPQLMKARFLNWMFRYRKGKK